MLLVGRVISSRVAILDVGQGRQGAAIRRQVNCSLGKNVERASIGSDCTANGTRWLRKRS
jgi:hypothetical protein